MFGVQLGAADDAFVLLSSELRRTDHARSVTQVHYTVFVIDEWGIYAFAAFGWSDKAPIAQALEDCSKGGWGAFLSALTLAVVVIVWVVVAFGYLDPEHLVLVSFFITDLLLRVVFLIGKESYLRVIGILIKLAAFLLDSVSVQAEGIDPELIVINLRLIRNHKHFWVLPIVTTLLSW